LNILDSATHREKANRNQKCRYHLIVNFHFILPSNTYFTIIAAAAQKKGKQIYSLSLGAPDYGPVVILWRQSAKLQG